MCGCLKGCSMVGKILPFAIVLIFLCIVAAVILKVFRKRRHERKMDEIAERQAEAHTGEGSNGIRKMDSF